MRDMLDRACCQCCGARSLDIIEGFERIPRVTSDSRPYPPGAVIGVCTHCSMIQTVPTARWFAEIADIYATYVIYHQSGGVEQAVIDQATGGARRRSAVLADQLRDAANLAATGRLLDVGCGNGAMLASIGNRLPRWDLFGLEVDDKHAGILETIPRFQKLYVGDLDVVDGQFDAVTMLHVLEHFAEPVTFVRRVREKVLPEGALFVQVPNFGENPFDLLVADHCCHFTLETLDAAVRAAGYDVRVKARDWAPKELSIVARPCEGEGTTPVSSSAAVAENRHLARDSVAWLYRVVETARSVSKRGQFGLLGTSLASTWLFGELGEAVEFFVDEDPSRIGTYLDRPVYPPERVRRGSNVFLPFPPDVAETVYSRLRNPDFALHLPPRL